MEEARVFISTLIRYLSPKQNECFLDLACGKGRHSILLNQMGFKVDGIDYSKNNVKAASRYETNKLKFYEHDMRKPLKNNHYNYIFNLFTSFGYFDSDQEHISCLKHIYNGLEDGGVFVLDFLNIHYVLNSLKSIERIESDGIHFNIERTFDKGYLRKRILFRDKDVDYHFEEQVRAYSKNDLVNIFTEIGFNIKDSFGNYNLEPFTESDSERLILIAVK